MTVTAFLMAVLTLLAGIYLFFTPMQVQKLPEKEIAQLELKGFTLYELSDKGLKTTLSGQSGQRYADRYEARGVHYTDSSQKYRQEMGADYGIYRDGVLVFEGNVSYQRADGLTFRSDEATYRQKTAAVTTEGPFTITHGADRVRGEKLLYLNKENKVSASNIEGSYFMNGFKE